ncbi:hypothetical protein [Microbispora bryophytorum]|uniref:hypothetical protein n=1 Tax=Microbispora bryophytorum TaxID=1460882 RepID=UPI0033F6AD95
MLTIATNRGERSTAEITSEIAIANQVSGVKLTFPASTPLEELLRHGNDTLRALNQLHARENSVHLAVASLLVDSLADATGKTPSEVVQRLALAIEGLFPEQA